MKKENVEALQYGKPGKNDPRKTPAKPSERRKGSKKNPPGSAKKPNKSISMSKETESKIRGMMTKHNSKGKGSKASMGALKSVFRRGAGAFSSTHAPNMSRTGWGIARVKAFLYLLRNGRPSNPNYKQDNDLLPSSHPRATEETIEDERQLSVIASMETIEAAKYGGKTVTINKPFRTPGERKKFAVYVKNPAGKVVIVRFGDPNMEIKRDDPARRKSFRSRHQCDTNPGPKTKARYWSCRMWEGGKSVTKLTSSEEINNQPLVESDMESAEAAYGMDEKKKEKEVTAIKPPKPSSNETHDEYMERCVGMGNDKDACMLAHKGHTFKEDEKEAGYGMDKKKLHKASVEYVFFDATITDAVAYVQASGKSVVKISGIAFHEGTNKNRWEITRAGVENIVKQMIGSDLTLNHPPTKEKGVGFTRNMDGGVNDAVVGIVTEAKIVDLDDNKYEVHYVAEVMRTELFPALESGLWTRGAYGVSIGGYGIPIATAEDGTMTFEADFTFDHLAIVHKPAYERADIRKVEKLEASDELIYQSESNENQPKVESNMSDEIESMATELEALKAELVLANATISENEAREAAIAEEARETLVNKASDMGLKGHEDLSSETIENLISSWEASRPEPVPEKVMAEATPASDESVSEVVEASEAPKKVVANYLNGEMVETEATLYARVYNSLVASYNSGNFSLNGDGQAWTYEEAVQKGLIKTQ
jgi:hypothetical protein